MLKVRPKTPQPAAFRSAFGTERQCRRFLFRQKWRGGFECPKCHHRGVQERNGGRRWVCSRKGCSYWESPTAGTIAESVKKPLRLWFWGLWLYVHARGGMTASRLQEELELGSYQTAWTWCHKFRSAVRTLPEWLSTFELPGAVLKGGQEDAQSASGLHGWHGGQQGCLASLRPSLGASPQLSAFYAWLRGLNSGRSSAKHGRAYWLEYQFWIKHASSKSRWKVMTDSLPGSFVPYWRLVGRKAPEIALTTQAEGRAAPRGTQRRGGVS
jgi:hypothetical protein